MRTEIPCGTLDRVGTLARDLQELYLALLRRHDEASELNTYYGKRPMALAATYFQGGRETAYEDAMKRLAGLLQVHGIAVPDDHSQG